MYKLSEISCKAPKELDKEATKEATKELLEELDELQNRLYAEAKQSVLVVFQGMDGSGKDGATKAVFKGINPQGIRTVSFKKPTVDELAQDFLWRVHRHTPPKGYIQIFNRSHYEDVLVVRVDGYVDDQTAQKRFKMINNFEHLLQNTGTRILKFYLHVSMESQLERFAERVVDPRKQWKFGVEDLQKFKQRDKYLKYYDDVFENCGPDIPWHIVPSDQNWYKEYYITKTIVKTLKDMDPQYPQVKIDRTDPEIAELIRRYSK